MLPDVLESLGSLPERARRACTAMLLEEVHLQAWAEAGHDTLAAAVASGHLAPPALGSAQLPDEDYTDSGACPVAEALDAPLPPKGDTTATLGSDGSTTVGAVVRRRLSLTP